LYPIILTFREIGEFSQTGFLLGYYEFYVFPFALSSKRTKTADVIFADVNLARHPLKKMRLILPTFGSFRTESALIVRAWFVPTTIHIGSLETRILRGLLVLVEALISLLALAMLLEESTDR
jgi:hypothetical protein